MKQGLYVLITFCFCFFIFSAQAGTLEDLKKKTGWQPRIHSEKLDSSGFDILRIDRVTEDSDWKGMKSQEVKVVWKSPQADDVTLRLYMLLGKGSEEYKSVILAEGTFDTTRGIHECGVGIPEFTVKRLGIIRDVYAELWYQDKLVAGKQGLAKYSPSGVDKSSHWWEGVEILETWTFYWVDPGLSNVLPKTQPL